MNVFAETKTNEEKAIHADILGNEILSRKRDRNGDFRNVVIDLQYNYSFSLHNSISFPANMKNYFLW